MGERHFILGTAGHVDHGKSALVKILTGTDPDRLPEEKRRGLTIDLGFACFDLDDHGEGAGVLRIGVVDVPGHEDFIRNMVAGVGSVDCVLLAVAADDGWMPQTEEHLQILSYLGVERAVVALTKIDLTGDDGAAAARRVRSRLRGSSFADSPIVPTSVVTASGIEALREALAGEFKSAVQSGDMGKPRLNVDRAFSLRGIGTVVTGTLTGGYLRSGQHVRVQPRGGEARVRNLQSFNKNVNRAAPGARVAVNLPNIGLDASAADQSAYVRRGDVLVRPGSGQPSATFDVQLVVSSRTVDVAGAAEGGVKTGLSANLHFGTASTPARIHLHGKRQVASGACGFAQLRLAEPRLGFGGDRFVLRDAAGRRTLAGGVILDPDASRRGFLSDARAEFLKMRAESLRNPEPWISSVLKRDGITPRSGLLDCSGFSEFEIKEAVEALLRRGEAVPVDESIADAEWWRNLLDAAVQSVDRHHAERPEQPGLSLSGLKRALPARLPSYDAFLSELSNRGVQRNGVFVARTGYLPSIAPRVQPAADRILAALDASPADPPSASMVADDPETKEALQSLVASGKVVRLDEKAILSAEGFASARTLISSFLSTRPSATVSEIRRALGSSRRIVVPLLEKLDRDGITIRQGDRRALRR